MYNCSYYWTYNYFYADAQNKNIWSPNVFYNILHFLKWKALFFKDLSIFHFIIYSFFHFTSWAEDTFSFWCPPTSHSPHTFLSRRRRGRFLLCSTLAFQVSTAISTSSPTEPSQGKPVRETGSTVRQIFRVSPCFNRWVPHRKTQLHIYYICVCSEGGEVQPLYALGFVEPLRGQWR